MKNLIFILFIATSLFGCQKEETQAAATSADGVSSAALSDTKDPLFEKEDDESCDTEEDLEKKIEQAAKKKEAVSLQGGDSGCDINE